MLIDVAESKNLLVPRKTLENYIIAAIYFFHYQTHSNFQLCALIDVAI